MYFSCIICAYNEQNQIHDIVQLALACEPIDEVIVINDGSSDKTQEILDTIIHDKLRVIHLSQNVGKLQAFFHGVYASKGNYIVMLDADYIGFHTTYLDRLITPIIEGKTDMTMMMLKNSLGICKFFKHDIFSGTRVLEKSIFENEDFFMKGKGFGLETLINEVVYTRRLRVLSLYFPEVYNPPKGWKQLLWKQPREVLRSTSIFRIMIHMWYIYRQQE